jgi:single-stranded DNA-binding protein
VAQAVPDEAGFVIRGGSRVVVGRLQQRSWTAEGGSTRSVLEVAAEELGLNLGAIIDVVQLVS